MGAFSRKNGMSSERIAVGIRITLGRGTENISSDESECQRLDLCVTTPHGISSWGLPAAGSVKILLHIDEHCELPVISLLSFVSKL